MSGHTPLPPARLSPLKPHYTYYLLADEPFLADLMEARLPWLYIGVRTARGPVERDPYMGSSEYVKAAMASGITFSKTVIRTHLSRKAANKDEKELLETYRHEHGGELWGYLYNRVVPGEFGPLTSVGIALRTIAIKRQGRALGVVRANRRGGPSPDYRPTDQHRAALVRGGQSYWADMLAFCAAHGIDAPGKGACNVDRAAFKAWREHSIAAPTPLEVVGLEGIHGTCPSPETAVAEPSHNAMPRS